MPKYNVVEDRVLIYEILGYLASCGNYIMEYNMDKANHVTNMIISILNNHRYFVYAPYDASVGIVIMILRLLCGCNRREDAIKIVDVQLNVLMHFFV